MSDIHLPEELPGLARRRRLLGLGLAAGAWIASPALAAPPKAKPKPVAKPVAHGSPHTGRAVVHGRPGAVAPSAPHVVQREPALVPRLTAQTEEGPFYINPRLLRADIAEGQAGVPMEVRFVIIDQTGLPFMGALVDIWHCNAQGVYSGFAGQGDTHDIDATGQTFLRGRQPVDRNGVAAFRTIYPGWTVGRSAHIHFKVWNGDNAVLTSQFFLPDALSEYLYTQLDDYRRTQPRDTFNSNDPVALQAGNSVLGSVREEREQYVTTLAVAVDRAAHPEPVAAAALAAPADASVLSTGPARARALAVVPGKR